MQLGLSGVAMFGPDGDVLQPSQMLRKHAVLVERGSFRPPTVVNMDMLECAAKFEADPDVTAPVLMLTELTVRNLLAGGDKVDRRDFLARADLLAACGMTVMISDYFAYHRLAAYLTDRTSERIGIVMGVPSLLDLFDESEHEPLPGGILESFGRLFKNDLKLFVYPMLRDGRTVTLEDVQVGDELHLLFEYLAQRGSFVGLDNYQADYLPIMSRDVLKRIARGDDSWLAMVPEAVARLIRERSFFRYQVGN